jgi:hypothetical protein
VKSGDERSEAEAIDRPPTFDNDKVTELHTGLVIEHIEEWGDGE